MQRGEATDLFIRHFSFWPMLSEREKQLLCEHTQRRKYAAGENIFNDQSNCLGVLLVKKGQLRAYTLSEDGREVTLYRLFPHEVGILSASCALRAVTFAVFMDAEEDTEVLLTSSDVFQQLTAQNIYVRCFGYELASARLSEMLWTMQQILFMRADKRLARFLLKEAAQRRTDELRLTHEQIARYMGSAREVVSRLLKYFVQEGIVVSARGCLRIVDKKKLQALAG
jgi:CRP/FNR family transcriptional regulator, anaerobic regulatory protein